MSMKNLRKAARKAVGDRETRILFVLMADRADDKGHFTANHEELIDELTGEVNAVLARLSGDHSVRWGVNNERVDRVYDVLREVLENE